MTEMTSRDVVEILGMVERKGVRAWIDGGWAVDALLGRQTRHHADLDIVIEQKYLDVVVEMLRTRGYKPVQTNGTRPWNFALGDGVRHQVDLHVIVLDEAGDGIYGPPAGGRRYPADALKGIGAIRGRPVNCISPGWRFGMPPPSEIASES